MRDPIKESCEHGCKDERTRSRHMDTHFDPRFICAKKSCGYCNVREDEGKKHGRDSGHRLIIVDNVPYWKQYQNRGALKRPRPEDATWLSKGDNSLLHEMPWITELPVIETKKESDKK